jgi:predicted enzyme related to lactoylglutathione lyase
MDWKLELILVPVSDVDRAKAFYVDQVGFHADYDQTVNDQIRFVQCTPRGSACSIAFGKGIARGEPGTAPGLQIVVSDIQEAHDHLKSGGVQVSEIDDQPWGRFVYFSDPDGNAWSIQQLPPRPQA